MGVRMHIDSDPPGTGEPPPPPPRRKQPSKPQVELDSEPEAAPQQKRSLSPGGFKLEGPGGWRLNVPGALIIALVAGGGGTAVGAKAFANNHEADAAVQEEIKLLRKEMREIAVDVRAARSSAVDNRTAFRKLANYTEESIAPVVASLRECCSVKLEYEGDDSANSIEFHPAPAQGSKAPRFQPKATIPAKPSM